MKRGEILDYSSHYWLRKKMTLRRAIWLLTCDVSQLNDMTPSALSTVSTFILTHHTETTQIVLTRHTLLVPSIFEYDLESRRPWRQTAVSPFTAQGHKEMSKYVASRFPCVFNTRFAFRYWNSRLRLGVWGRCVDQRLAFIVHQVYRRLSTRFKELLNSWKVQLSVTCREG